jgi:hypothetical protein
MIDQTRKVPTYSLGLVIFYVAMASSDGGDGDPPDTPMTCEACGGAVGEECPWCDGGFQSVAQQGRWRVFRKRMRGISGTYSMLRDMIETIIERLDRATTIEARALAEDGRARLRRWILAEPATAERMESTRDLAKFNGEALDYLMSLRDRDTRPPPES